MKLVIHIGMPKCASTSIQNEIHGRALALSTDSGFYYRPDSDRFQNHHKLAALVNTSDDLKAAVDLLRNQKSEAMALGCETIFISSEDLFFMMESERKIDFFNIAIDAAGLGSARRSYVMVFRQLEDFFKSYLKQLVSNGNTVAQESFLDLYEFFVKLIRRFFALDGERIAISLDNAKKENGLLDEFLINVVGGAANGRQRFDNSWGSRTFVSEMLCGQVVGLHAINENLHPNEPTSDEYRSVLRLLIDEASADAAVRTLFVAIEKRLDLELNSLLERSRLRLGAADKEFLAKLYKVKTLRLSAGASFDLSA